MRTIQKLANAVKTYYNCNGHYKAQMNKVKITTHLNELNSDELPENNHTNLKDYFSLLKEYKWQVPDIDYLLSIGEFNGEGSY